MVSDLETPRTNEKLGKEVGESREQIRRFIRLTELVPEILQMVDERQIAFRPAVEISYLSEEQQYTLLEAMGYNDATPSLAQAIKMKKFMQEGKLTDEVIQSIMQEDKPNQNLCGMKKYKVDLGVDALGNLTRIENEIAKLPARLEAAKMRKEETITQLETAKEEVKKPFAFENELKEKMERLNALNIELNLNEKDNAVIDDGQEQDNGQPEKKCMDRER